jgi:hypothetical protein
MVEAMSLNTMAAPRQKLMKERATVVATTTLVVEELCEDGSGAGMDIICKPGHRLATFILG